MNRDGACVQSDSPDHSSGLSYDPRRVGSDIDTRKAITIVYALTFDACLLQNWTYYSGVPRELMKKHIDELCGEHDDAL